MRGAIFGSNLELVIEGDPVGQLASGKACSQSFLCKVNVHDFFQRDLALVK